MGTLPGEVVLLGEDDEAEVRMPTAAEQQAYGFAADEPVVEIWRWNGITEIHGSHGAAFMFVSGEHEPDRQPRLATIARIVADLTATVHNGRPLPSEERLAVRYQVGRTTLRRALARLRPSGSWPDGAGWPT